MARLFRERLACTFAEHLGRGPAAGDSRFLVSRQGGPRYTNHLGTVRASALHAVAEAGACGRFRNHAGKLGL
jgi:hypothetical protein